MADTLVDFLTEVHTELNTLSGGTVASTPAVIDDRAVFEHEAPPRVVWVDAPSGVGPAEIVFAEGNDGTVATDQTRLECHIWQTDRENARNTLHNIIRAFRNVGYGPNFEVLGYEWAPQSYAKFGRVIVARIQISIPVGNTAKPTATITSHTHTVTVDGEVVC